MKKINFALVFLVFGLSFVSCKKENIEPVSVQKLNINELIGDWKISKSEWYLSSNDSLVSTIVSTNSRLVYTYKPDSTFDKRMYNSQSTLYRSTIGSYDIINKNGFFYLNKVELKIYNSWDGSSEELPKNTYEVKIEHLDNTKLILNGKYASHNGLQLNDSIYCIFTYTKI